MSKPTFVLLAIFATSLTLQSCFEIREIVHISKDGSGTFSLVMDMSKVREMLTGISSEEDVISGSPYQNMEKGYAATREKLEAIDGISNIRLSAEMEGYVVTSSFDFTGMDALNAGMDVIYENELKEGNIPEYYKFKRGRFERTDSHDFLNIIKNEFSPGEMGMEGMDLSTMFADVAYVNTIIFDGAEIRRIRSGDVEVSDDGSTVTSRYLIFDDESEQSPAFRVRLR